jgi:deoxyribonuclease-4
MLNILKRVLGQWNKECLLLLENNAGTKGGLGTTLEELVQIRNLCDYPEKIGFCLDTCHAFASGLWNGENTEALFAKGESLGYLHQLQVIHFNNSKYPTGSKKDRHANIFQKGYIKEEELAELVKSPILKNIPFILETPDDEGVTHKEEIEMIRKKWDKV